MEDPIDFSRMTHDDIQMYVERGGRLRSEKISEFGRRMRENIAALFAFRRRLVPQESLPE